jgi:trimeric autotransporter adhesin
VAHSEGLRRLGGSLSAGLADAQSSLQASVRGELGAAVEPLRQLPQLVAAAAAAAAASSARGSTHALQTDAVDAESAPDAAADDAGGSEGSNGSDAHTDSSALPPPAALPQLREAWVAAAVSSVAAPLLAAQQAELLAALAAAPPRPAPLAEEQWEALGRRLARLERLLASVPELGEQTLVAQLAPLRASAAAQEAGLARISTAAEGLAAATAAAAAASAGGDGSAGGDMGLLAAELGALRMRVDEIAGQLGGRSTGGSLGDEGVPELLAAVRDGMSRLLQQAAAGADEQAPAPADPGPALAALQAQLSGLAAALQQVQLDMPLQLQLALAQSAVGAGGGAAAAQRSGDGYDGVAFGDDAGAAAAAAAAAASAASAAAQGVAEVRGMLGGVLAACETLQVQLTALTAQADAQRGNQQAAADAAGRELEAAAAQLAGASGALGDTVTDRLELLCAALEERLAGLQARLLADAADAAAAAAASASAAAAAATAAAAAAAAAPPLQQQQQQQLWPPPLTTAAADGGLLGTGQLPQQQQQQWGREGDLASVASWQQQVAAGGGWDTYAAAAAAPPPPPPLPSDQVAGQPPALPGGNSSSSSGVVAVAQAAPSAPMLPVVPGPAGLSEEQLRSEGLRLLREGRDATRGSGQYAASGPSYAAAEALLQGAVACLGTAIEAAPDDSRVLGNLGNALLAQGELKRALLDELTLAAAAGDRPAAEGGDDLLPAGVAAAERRLRCG